MKKLNLLVTAAALVVAPNVVAETMVIGSNTWDVTKTTTQLASGIKQTKIKWNTIRSSAYTDGSLAYVIEADLTDPTVGIELITNGLTGTKTLANHATNAKTGTAIAGANSNFWITSPEKANYACMGTQSHGIEVSNGTMYTEPNVRDFAHCGGPVDWTGMFVVDNDGKAYIDFVNPTVGDSDPGSGFEFNALVVEKGWRFGLNKCNRWCSSGSASIFTKAYGTSKAFRTGDLSGDTYTSVNGQATEILLDFAPGTTDWNLGGVTKFVIKEIRQNAGNGTLGTHDCAIVGRDSYATVANQQCAVGQTIEISTKVNFKSQGSPNGIAQATSGNVLVMKDGAITSAFTQQNTTGTYNTTYYARTLYGLSADRTKFYMIVCEHYPKQVKSTFGFTTEQLALILKTFGASNVFQVDCGGSAQMWTKAGGQLITSTDSGGVRAVHNGLFVVSKNVTTPNITSTCANTAFGSVTVNESSSKSFSVTGQNLTGNISLSLSGANANQFSVSPATLSASGNFTVTYKPTAVGTHSATLTIASAGATSLTYTLSGTGKEYVDPATSGDRANYAYALSQSGDKANGYTLSYKLTGDVKSASVVLTDRAGKSVTVAGGTAKGLNNVTVSPDKLDVDAVYNWKVVVNSKPVAADASFFHEAPSTLDARGGVGIVTDPESNAYGRIVTSVGYAQGFGLYEPDMSKVGQYLAGNSPWVSTNRSSTYRLSMRDRKVAYACDFSDKGAGYWAFNPEHPEYGTSNLIGGTNDGTGCFKLADGTVVGSGSPAICFEGEGENTRLWIFAEDWPSGNSSYKGIVARWDIGNATKIEKGVNAAYGQYVGTGVFANQNMNIVATSHGVFLCQTRANGSQTKSVPGFIFTNIYGDELYNSGNHSDIIPSCGSGLAISADEKLLAVSGGKLNTRLYSVEWNGDVPSLTFIREVEGTAGDNDEVSQMVFDPAGNLICWKRSTTATHNGIHAYALANTNPVAETPAKAAMTVYGPEQGNPDPEPDPEPQPEPATPITADDITEEYVFSTNKGNLSQVAVFSSDAPLTRDFCVIDNKMYVLNASTSAWSIAIVDAYTPTDKLGEVNVDGIAGGTIPLSGIKSLGSQLIGCNYVSANGALKLYRWTDTSAAPEVILNTTDHGSIATGRSFMTSGDETDGKIAFAANGGSKIVYYTMNDGVLNPTPVVINLTLANGTAYTQSGNESNQDVSFMADGSFWLFNKDTHPVHFDATGKQITTLSAAHMGNAKVYGQGGRVFNYAGNDYVAGTATLGSTASSAWGNVTMSLVDISEGSTAAKHIGLYPATGLGEPAFSDAGNTAVEYQVEGDNEGLSLWVLAPKQGLARYSVGKVTTGVNNIKVDADDVEVAPVYYNLNGVRVAADRLAPGIYIRVRGTKTDKIVIR